MKSQFKVLYLGMCIIPNLSRIEEFLMIYQYRLHMHFILVKVVIFM